LRCAASPSAAIPGVVLCVADRVVRVVARASDDSRGRSRREINLLIGVAAGEGKRCDHDRDKPDSGTFVWSMRIEVGHHTLRSKRGDLIEQRRRSFNSKCGQPQRERSG
jgi:hypothetical protein